ncbi:Uncharacterized protein PECH_000133 [Penicillium ucsense]|uniref:Uncharacterized protein n=1 Tax=Penicillium ucsense TaxID=2839758 RepID=A0A8J8WHR6_9EURO|nr:Uncharacterized protein PECM_005772 [Penicillium ucsense]KAF7739613.1 Uncharacterized protein PECH_000133 [Penicillium ucsense]
MAEVGDALPSSLLDAIRTQLRIDSDSESSQSTVITVLDARGQPSSPTTPLDEEMSSPADVPPTPVSVSACFAQVHDTEPFPSFDEGYSEEQREWDHDIQASIMTAMQAQIRRENIDQAIIAPANQPEKKHRTLDRVKEHLSNPQMCSSTRERFIALTNMVIRLDHVLYERSEEFLGMADVAAAAEIVEVVLRYLRWMDEMLGGLVATAENVFGAFHFLSAENVPAIYKFRQMSRVASAHLRKPKVLEQQLLSLYLDLFDEWVHERFLHLSNRKILQDNRIEPDCLQLISHVHDVWEILMRNVRNYAAYTDQLEHIRLVYLTPVFTMTEMAVPPEIVSFLLSGEPLQGPEEEDKDETK